MKTANIMVSAVTGKETEAAWQKLQNFPPKAGNWLARYPMREVHTNRVEISVFFSFNHTQMVICFCSRDGSHKNESRLFFN